jgi:RNA polymerase sigma-70 factor (ECF subfamily)
MTIEHAERSEPFGTDPAPGGSWDALRELMVRYQAGDPAAFDAIYDSLEPELRAYLSSLCLNHALTEDLLQESFLQIHRSRHTYLPSRPVRPWAFAISRHVYKMHCRGRARRRKHEAQCAIPDRFLSVATDRLADRESLARALASIAPDRREAILLHHGLGFSFREIGALLGVRSGAVKVRAHRGLAELRGLLGAKEDGTHER